MARRLLAAMNGGGPLRAASICWNYLENETVI